jgi:predicted restriction endonuclease
MSDLTRERLLRKVSEISVWKHGDQRAPHKPLLILFALGKLFGGENEIRFKDSTILLRNYSKSSDHRENPTILSFRFGTYAPKGFGKSNRQSAGR